MGTKLLPRVPATPTQSRGVERLDGDIKRRNRLDGKDVERLLKGDGMATHRGHV